MLSTIRVQRLTATATTATGLAFTATALSVSTPGLAVLGAATAWFGAAALVALRPRYARRAPLRAKVHAVLDDPTSLDFPIEPATWTEVDGFAVFADGSFVRLAEWTPGAAA